MRTAASYARCVKGLPRRGARSPRVYYSSMWTILALVVLAVGSAPPAARAQVEITWSPSMVKGPTGAPVTIVEFSDYQ